MQPGVEAGVGRDVLGADHAFDDQFVGDEAENGTEVGALLEARLDAAIHEGGHVWDRAPAALLVHEAGGRVDDLRGGGRLDERWLVYAADGVADGLAGLLRDVGA